MDWGKYTARKSALSSPDRPASSSETPQGPQLVVKPDVVRKPYSAFELVPDDGKPHPRLGLLPMTDIPRMPRWSTLNDVVWNSDGSEIGLLFSHRVIHIIGRNLMPLVDALQLETLEWVRAFDARYHLPVEDDGLPFVIAIDVSKPLQAGDDSSDLERLH